MTGLLSERVNGYGEQNGFEMSTVVGTGRLSRRGKFSKLAFMVEEDDPDAVFISLGMNELFEAQPDRKLKSAVEGILSAVGTRTI